MSKKRSGHRKKPKARDRKLTAQLSKQSKRPRALAKGRETNLADDDSLQKPTQELTTHPEPRGRGDSGMLLTDPNRMRSDLNMVERAVNKGWNVRRKTMLRRRLEDIVAKTTADVVTKNGTVDSESAADELAIKAATVLVKMDAADVDRVKTLREMADPKNAPPQPLAINVTNNNITSTTVNNVDERRLGLARLAERFGARELIVDGRPVPIAQLTGTAAPVPSTDDVGTNVPPTANEASRKAN